MESVVVVVVVVVMYTYFVVCGVCCEAGRSRCRDLRKDRRRG